MKFKCPHIGHEDTGENCEMEELFYVNLLMKKDLGVTANMTVSEQCRSAASKGNVSLCA